MELLCPGCQKPLTIDNQHAGQMMKCPMCAGTFMAPALPAAPPAPPVVATPQPSAPASPLADAGGSPLPEAAPPPPMPPGDYTRKHTIWISPRIVVWIGPVGLSALFALSFFWWQTVGWSGEVSETANLWELAFAPSGAYIAYVILTLFLAWPLSIASMLVGRNQIPVPPSLQMLVPLHGALVGCVALLGFAILLIECIKLNFSLFNPSTLWMSLAFRVHLIAVIGFFLEYWLELRKTSNLPPPKIEIHT